MRSSNADRQPPPVPIRPVEDLSSREQLLPRPLTSFLGREAETEAICNLLRRPDVRLVTITGPGGAGKTRIAIRIAEVMADYVEARFFVPLAAIRDPNLVLPTIAQALGVREAGSEYLLERLSDFLALRETFVILDNVEQVVDVTPVITELLTRCPDAQVLATSRVVLHASGEHDFPLPPLDVPGRTHQVSFDDLARSPAIALFTERAQAANPAFALTDANAGTVRDICAGLDGLPLAIELAAAHSRTLTPAALHARLSNRLSLLSGGPRDQPPRLRAMRDTIGWSYDLLDPPERALFRRLCAFVDGFTLEAAHAIAGRQAFESGTAIDGGGPEAGEDAFGVLSGLELLIDTSLLTQEPQPDGEPRFRILETIREFGLDRLINCGEYPETRDRHAAYYLDLAEQAESRLIANGAASWVERLALERANLRAAVARSLEAGQADAVLRLAGTLLSFAYARGEPAEALDWLSAALKQGQNSTSESVTDALFAASALAQVQGDFGRSVDLCTESLALARRHHYHFGEARALLGLGITAEWQGELATAAAHYEASGRLMEQVGDSDRLHHWRVLPIANLADIALLNGDTAGAIALGATAVARWREVGYVWGTAQALGTVAAACCERGELAKSAALTAETLDLWIACNDGRGLAGVIAGVAAIAAARGLLERSALLFGAAWALANRLGVRFMAHHVYAERKRAALRLRLDEATFTAAWDAGSAFSLDEALVESRNILNASPPRTRPEHGLTARELDVLRLLADGHSDREIASRLSISPRTVQSHVAGLFAKLEASSRAEAAALAVRRGLV